VDPTLSDLLRLFELEPLEVNLFRGESRDIGSPQVFGGQVLGQALTAASMTVSERVVHSFHAYFLRRGDFNAPIVYSVDRSLEGHSFANRRVVAIQHGEQIFNMTASFQRLEDGLEHQAGLPEVPPPEELPDLSRPPPDVIERMSERRRLFFQQPRPFEFRPVEPQWELRTCEPRRHVWLRAAGEVPAEESLHRCLLAYVSDFFLLETATLPHPAKFASEGLVMASIDHAMWFHRPLRVDEWLLYVTDSPSASGARGFNRGSFFSRDGRLVASTAQEGLIRVRRPAGAA
jgi:acyl-CoA thioesterase II